MSHHHSHNSAENIKVAFFLNLAFTIVEIIGGLFTNSVAILSDAIHDLGDSLSLAVTWYLENYSEKQADQAYTYGYRRFSLLGAIFTSLVLIFGSILVLSEAIPRLMNPEATNAPGMVLLALVGILVNGAAVVRLRHATTLSAQAVSWHMLEDVLGWVAVLFVGVIMSVVELPILDPILSIMLSAYVLYNVLKNVREALRVFLQAVPASINLSALGKQLTEIKHVVSEHHTHIWSLDGEHHVLSSHLVVKDSTKFTSFPQIRQEVQQLVEDHEFEHLTIQIEYESDPCPYRQ